MTRGYQTVSYYFSFYSQRILVIFHINLLINKNICRWLVNWNVQFSGWLWNVSGNTLHFFSDKMFTRCEFQKWKRQMTDHQKASVYHVATTGVRFRILKNISKYFEVFLQSLKHHKMTILQNRQDLQMFPINIVAV